MAYQKTWQFVPNYVPTNASAANLAKNIIWFWSRILLGDQTALTWKDQTNTTIGGSVTGKWFVWGSTDGGGVHLSTGGTSGSPATDYWTSTFTAGNIVQNTAGSNHSWICLGSPSSFGGTGQGSFYIIIDCSNATTNNINIVMCKATPTGGTLTARPTSTDEVVLQTIPWNFLPNTATLNFHIYGMLSTDGIARIFHSRDGIGSFQGALCVEAFNGAISGDPWPASFLAYAQDSPSGSTWLWGLAGNGWNFNSAVPANNNGCWRGRNFANTITGSYTAFVPTFFDSAAGNYVGGFSQNTNASGKMYGSNPATGNWDNLPWWGLIGANDSNLGFRGSLFDVGLANARKNVNPILIPDGTYDPTNGAMCTGDAWVPACVSPVM